MKIINLKQKS